MPLVTAPSRGFSDWQRTGPFDSGVLFSESNAAHNGNKVTPFLDVSRFAYLGGRDLVAGHDVHVIITWATDSAGSNQIGSREFVLSPNVNFAAQYRLPNLGPFAQVVWSPFGANAWTHTVQLIGTNRFHPLEFIPNEPALISADGVALGANATVTTWSSDYYAGPVDVYFLCAQLASVLFDVLDTADALHDFEFVPTAANAQASKTVITPPGAWQVNVHNTTAVATTFKLYVTPSMTGST